MQAQTPKNWPEGTKYLRAPSYSKKLTKDKLNTLLFSRASLLSQDPIITTRGPYENVRIAPISSTSHPAHGQYGLFATQHLPPNTFILPYLGYVHDQSDLDETSDYDLSLDRDLGVGVDASKMGNEARFINDYRGISTGPNAEFRDVLVDVGFGILEKRMGIFVLSAGKSGKRAKGIGRGEEVLLSYGKGFWAGRQSTAG
ncbi:SET domain-containing protein [Stagonosporopsis vannaccii]|nr:SET domain-containing protein [Stagonosporopsis vannaccii]